MFGFTHLGGVMGSKCWDNEKNCEGTLLILSQRETRYCVVEDLKQLKKCLHFTDSNIWVMKNWHKN